MKYMIIPSLIFIFSCISRENKSAVVTAETKDTIVAVDSVKAIPAMPEETTLVLLDGIRPGTDLTPVQVLSYFHVDTTYYKDYNVRSELGSINLLGDSLLIVVLHQENNNCSKSTVYILNRYSFSKISEKDVEISCDMDNQSQDRLSYVFTNNNDFVVTTETYDKGVDSDGPSATKKEYWAILTNGQFEKNKPDEEVHNKAL